MLRIVLGNDHSLSSDNKEKIINYLKSKNCIVIDAGTNKVKKTHYPLYAYSVANFINTSRADFGIVICGSGYGVGIAINKINGINCCYGWNVEDIYSCCNSIGCNVLSIGIRFNEMNNVFAYIDAFLSVVIKSSGLAKLDSFNVNQVKLKIALRHYDKQSYKLLFIKQ